MLQHLLGTLFWQADIGMIGCCLLQRQIGLQLLHQLLPGQAMLIAGQQTEGNQVNAVQCRRLIDMPHNLLGQLAGHRI